MRGPLWQLDDVSSACVAQPCETPALIVITIVVTLVITLVIIPGGPGTPPGGPRDPPRIGPEVPRKLQTKKWTLLVIFQTIIKYDCFQNPQARLLKHVYDFQSFHDFMNSQIHSLLVSA